VPPISSVDMSVLSKFIETTMPARIMAAAHHVLRHT
jgi:hypothetical protein